jgi:hypothetical protein
MTVPAVHPCEKGGAIPSMDKTTFIREIDLLKSMLEELVQELNEDDPLNRTIPETRKWMANEADKFAEHVKAQADKIRSCG